MSDIRERILRDLIMAAFELATVRFQLIGEDGDVPDLDMIVPDIIKALNGVDSCDDRPCVEWTRALERMSYGPRRVQS